jgi:hypothetical protein
LNSNEPLLTIEELVIDPVDPPAPILRVPALIVVAPVYVFAAASKIDPAPIFVNVLAPPVSPIMFDKVRLDPDSAPILAFAASVIAPVRELLPLELRIAPSAEAPVPLTVKGSAIVILFESDSVAPLSIVVPAAVEPSADPFVTTRVPEVTVVLPV